MALRNLQSLFLNVKHRFSENTYDSILGLVNAVPTLVGYNFHNDRISAPFWVLHLSLMMYIYGAGCFVYQLLYARTAGDFIKSYVMVAILVQLLSISHWFLKERPLLKAVLAITRESDNLAKDSSQFHKKHIKMLSLTKKIILVFYAINYINEFTVYLPHRTSLKDDFAMAMKPCPGMDITTSPSNHICTALLTIQELTIAAVALNYQMLLLFLIAHTAAMYQLLGDEMMTLNHVTNRKEVKGKLTPLIYRHVLIVDVVSKLKVLYSSPLGVNFASNAVCIALFFYLELEEWMTFLPIMMYCFLVFFLYCFLCQSMVNAAERFERAVYSCGWEKFGVNERKMVYVMLMQSQQKVELMAADIVPVNIYTFAATLQFMFKFVTVMKF